MLHPAYRRIYLTPSDYLYVMDAQFTPGTSLDNVTVLGWNRWFRDPANTYTLIGSLVRHSKRYGINDQESDIDSIKSLAMLASVVALKQREPDTRSLLIHVPSSVTSANRLPSFLVELVGNVASKSYEIGQKGVLKREREYGQLKELSSKDDRVSSVRYAMVADRAIVAGRAVLIIDDVLESGSTLRECARALKSAGASRVTAITMETTRKFGMEIMSKR